MTVEIMIPISKIGDLIDRISEMHPMNIFPAKAPVEKILKISRAVSFSKFKCS